jgi:hypothetical protein
MLNHARRRMMVVPIVASVFLWWECAARAQPDLPSPTIEPWLAEPGDRYADFNQSQIACYQGSMTACDAIWLNHRVLLDSGLGRYGRTCAGRANLRAISRQSLKCTEAFPGND